MEVKDFKAKLKKENSQYGICSFAVVRGKDIKYLIGNACSAPLRHERGPEVTGLAGSLWHGQFPNLARSFYEFVFDKECSPWRSLFVDGYWHDFDEECWYIPVTKETSYQLLFNFSIVTRLAYETPASVWMWNKLVNDHGFTKIEALFFIANFYSYANSGYNENLRLTNAYGGHYPFGNEFSVSWKAIKEGTPNVDKNEPVQKPFKDWYPPINSIWQSKTDNRRRVSNFFKGVPSDKERAYTGSFKKAWDALKAREKYVNATYGSSESWSFAQAVGAIKARPELWYVD